MRTCAKSKLICDVNAVQNPTNHYQIPALMNQIFTNLNSKPSKISADTIYLTWVNLNYLDNLDISTLIPTPQQNRENSGNLPENQFAIDYFDFDEYKNVVICPEKHELTLDGEYDTPPEKSRGNKLKLLYSNYFTCINCKFTGICFTKNHRTITQQVYEVAYKTERLMASEE